MGVFAAQSLATLCGHYCGRCSCRGFHVFSHAQKVKCAREALRSWRVSRPPGHEDFKDAKERVLESEGALG